MKYTLTAVIVKEDKCYVVHCPELGVTSQGETIDEALVNLKEAAHLFLQDADPDTIPATSNYPMITTIEVAV